MASSYWKFLLVGILVFIPRWVASKPENPLRRIQYRRSTINYDAGASVFASPSIIDQSSAMVEVSYIKGSGPEKGDWIGVWLLSSGSISIDPKKHAPTKYQYCDFDKSYSSTGTGNITLQLLNMRATYQIGLLTGGLSDPNLIAASNIVQFTNPDQPLQAHLALTKNYSEMVLMWTTKNSKNPQVKWGMASGQYNSLKNATSSTYSASDMCDTPATDYGWIDPGMMHTVLIDGLQPSTQYFYIFGSEDGGWSEQRVFVSPPVLGPDQAVKILAYGDMGHGEVDMSNEVLSAEQASLNTTANLVNQTGDFAMHIGDICYAEGFGATWEEFFYQLQPVMSRMPYMVNPGNHESDSKNSNAYYQGHDSGGECSVPYVNRFAMPRESPEKPWYDFSYGNIHVVMMSTEHDFQTTSDQYSDLVKMLENVNRTLTPWLIFSGHRPMYISSTYGTTETSDIVVAKLLQANVEPLLVKYKVDLALWGHHHSYQRTCPVNKEECIDGSPVHAVIGMAGQGLSRNVDPVKPKYFEYIDDNNHGYTRIVATFTTLSLEYVRNIDDKVADSLIIPKKEL